MGRRFSGRDRRDHPIVQLFIRPLNSRSGPAADHRQHVGTGILLMRAVGPGDDREIEAVAVRVFALDDDLQPQVVVHDPLLRNVLTCDPDRRFGGLQPEGCVIDMYDRSGPSRDRFEVEP